MPARRVHKETFVTTPASGSTTIPAGTGTTTSELNPIDLSHAQALLCELDLTTVGTDGVDKLDVKIQSASTDANGNRVWTTRGRFPLVSGTDTTPRHFILNIEQAVAINQTEQSYQVTTDSGVTEINSGTVINGPFPGKSRKTGFVPAGSSNQQASWRVLYGATDANSNANWVGSLTIWAYDTVRF